MQLLGNLLKAVKPSPTLAITRKAAELRRNGADIISLSTGEPDFPTPDHINAAAKAAIDAGQTRYTDVDGTPELKAAIVRKFQRENGITYATDEISVGTGGKQVLINALQATLNPGDEVIIPAPYWVSYPDMVRLAGGHARGNPLRGPSAFQDHRRATPASHHAAYQVADFEFAEQPDGGGL